MEISSRILDEESRTTFVIRLQTDLVRRLFLPSMRCLAENLGDVRALRHLASALGVEKMGFETGGDPSNDLSADRSDRLDQFADLDRQRRTSSAVRCAESEQSGNEMLSIAIFSFLGNRSSAPVQLYSVYTDDSVQHADYSTRSSVSSTHSTIENLVAFISESTRQIQRWRSSDQSIDVNHDLLHPLHRSSRGLLHFSRQNHSTPSRFDHHDSEQFGDDQSCDVVSHLLVNVGRFSRCSDEHFGVSSIGLASIGELDRGEEEIRSIEIAADSIANASANDGRRRTETTVARLIHFPTRFTERH